MIVSDLPWGEQSCPSCGRRVQLAVHDLSCPCWDTRSWAAVGWICQDCSNVIELLGLFTSWDAALTALGAELDRRGVLCVRQHTS
jgi:phage terminase large subunit GpA-like protein